MISSSSVYFLSDVFIGLLFLFWLMVVGGLIGALIHAIAKMRKRK